MSATATAEATKARSDEATKGKCTCAQIRDAMADGCHNPEAAEEYRQAHGHYDDCPARNGASQADEPIYFIHRRKGVKYNGRWYNSQAIQRYAGSGVLVQQARGIDGIFILDLQSNNIGVAFPVPAEPTAEPAETDRPFDRLGSYDMVHRRTFEVDHWGVLVAGRWYQGPTLAQRLHARVRVAPIPGNEDAIAVLDFQGKLICEAQAVDYSHPQPADLARIEFQYALEATDKLLTVLREQLRQAEAHRHDTQRRIDSLVAQLNGREAEAPPCLRASVPSCLEQADASHAQRLEEDDSQPGPDYME